MGDGHILYQGKATDAREYFAQQGYTFHHRNPADYFMKILTFNHPKTEEDIVKLNGFKQSYDKALRPEIQEQNHDLKCPDLDVTPNRKLMAPFRTQFA